MGIKTTLLDYFKEYKGNDLFQLLKEVLHDQEEDLTGIPAEDLKLIKFHTTDNVLANFLETVVPEVVNDSSEIKNLFTTDKKPEVTKDDVINRFLVGNGQLSWFMKSSVEVYQNTGKITGTLRIQIKEMLDAYKNGCN